MVGDILKKRREESGQDLREISNILKIKHAYLKAIEDGAFENLPEAVYVKGYIRKYAEYLKIDPETAINAYVQQISPTQAENKEVLEQEIVQKKRVKLRYVIIPALSALFVLTIIFIFSPFSPSEKKVSQLPPETKIEGPSTPVETGQELYPLKTKNQASSSPAEQKKEPPLPLIETEKETISKPVNFFHVLEVFATDTTWLSITADETGSKELLMNPGESARLQAKNGFTLKIGNAGGIKLVFDGKEIKKLGEKGQVIKINLPNPDTNKE